jgi:hypothetical protein
VTLRGRSATAGLVLGAALASSGCSAPGDVPVTPPSTPSVTPSATATLPLPTVSAPLPTAIQTRRPEVSFDGAAYLVAADSFNDGYRALLGPDNPLELGDLPELATLLANLRAGLRPLAGLEEGQSMDSALGDLQAVVREQLEDMPPSQADGLTFLVDFALREDVSPAADALRSRLGLPPRRGLGLPNRDDDEYV